MATLKLIVDPTEAERGYRRVGQAAEDFKERARRSADEIKEVGGSFDRMAREASTAETAFGRLGRGLGSFSRTVASVKGAVVGVAGAAGIGLLVNRSLQAADAIDKAADRAGVGAERLQTLRFAAEQSGVAAGTFDNALQRLNRRLGLFQQDGAGPAANAFEELGLATEITSGQLTRTSNVFDVAVTRLQQFENASERAALASQLFGEDAGPRLATLLNQGTAGIEALETRARRLGLVLREDAIDSAVEAGDQLAVLGEVIRVNVVRAVTRAAPALNSLLTGLLEQLPTAITQIELFAERLGLIDDISDQARLFRLRDELSELREEFDAMNSGVIRGAANAFERLERPTGEVAGRMAEVSREIGVLTGDLDPLARQFGVYETEAGDAADANLDFGNSAGEAGDKAEKAGRDFGKMREQVVAQVSAMRTFDASLRDTISALQTERPTEGRLAGAVGR